MSDQDNITPASSLVYTFRFPSHDPAFTLAVDSALRRLPPELREEVLSHLIPKPSYLLCARKYTHHPSILKVTFPRLEVGARGAQLEWRILAVVPRLGNVHLMELLNPIDIYLVGVWVDMEILPNEEKTRRRTRSKTKTEKPNLWLCALKRRSLSNVPEIDLNICCKLEGADECEGRMTRIWWLRQSEEADFESSPVENMLRFASQDYRWAGEYAIVGEGGQEVVIHSAEIAMYTR